MLYVTTRLFYIRARHSGINSPRSLLKAATPLCYAFHAGIRRRVGMRGNVKDFLEMEVVSPVAGLFVFMLEQFQRLENGLELRDWSLWKQVFGTLTAILIWLLNLVPLVRSNFELQNPYFDEGDFEKGFWSKDMWGWWRENCGYLQSVYGLLEE